MLKTTLLILTFLPLFSIAQEKFITGAMGLKFGQSQAQVKAAVIAKGGKLSNTKSNDSTFIAYEKLKFAGRESFLTMFKFVNDKLFEIINLIEPSVSSKVVDLYSDIKAEINSKYYVATDDYEQYTYPYEKGDGHIETALKLGKAEFNTFWTFESQDGTKNDYIQLSITTSMLVRITYQDGELAKVAAQKRKAEAEKDY